MHIMKIDKEFAPSAQDFGFQQKINLITTPIITKFKSSIFSATGFFYSEETPSEEFEGADDVNQVWLITNRHVVLCETDSEEMFVDSLTFKLRWIKEGTMIFEEIKLLKDDLITRTKFHTDKEIDVVAIRVLDLFLPDESSEKTHEEVLKEKQKRGLDEILKDIRVDEYPHWVSITNEMLPDRTGVKIQVADDVIVIGYPKGFYDYSNTFPIVKGGIIASKWGSNFNEKPHFIIDAKLFPGSSGSLVITKPDYIRKKVGDTAKKDFVFLGIFSGEFTTQSVIETNELTIKGDSGLNAGIVWYGNLIEQIIEHGVSFQK